MKFPIRPRVVAAACALIACSVVTAAAQQPTLEAFAAGDVVTAQWTVVPGATGYTVDVTGTVNTQINLAASPNFFRVNAPAGTYNIRIRGTAGSVTGPFSNTVTVTVTVGGPGPGGCSQIGGLTASSNTSGGSVQITWTQVPGTLGYRVEFSRFSGSTELTRTLPAGSNSTTQFVGMVGTFYARVVAGNACSTSTSNEVQFRIETLAGPGPRTPDPAPGTVLPLPGYGPAVANAVANAFNEDLQNSCVEHGGNNAWLLRLVNALRQQDTRWGLNWKRGNVGDLSQDIVTYNYGSGADEGTTDVYIIDTIGNHCGSGAASPNWQDQTGATRAGGGIGRWTLQPYLRFFPGGDQQ
ncbi:MAG TPA: hypothetical protein VNJ02_17705 [Vicinamibacterales bacterium]|nr:hypothetical protein [Vicinamibacterales bacterium]